LLLERWPEPPWAAFDLGVPRRAAGAWLVMLGAAFAALWLRQVLPALREGTDPEGSAELGLLTNPVHVLDLSFLCPLMLAPASRPSPGPSRRGVAPMLLAFTVFPVGRSGERGVDGAAGRRGRMPMAAISGAVAVRASALVGFLRGLRR
jgi:hypothetical protein